MDYIKKHSHSLNIPEIFKISFKNNSNIESYNNTEIFIKQMNKTCKIKKLLNTTFSNPHGLADKGNKSSPSDLAKLVSYAKNE